MTDSAPTTRVVTPEATLSFPHLFQPWAPKNSPNQEPKYSCALVFDPGADITELRTAATIAAREKWGDELDGMLANGQIRLPWRTDVAKKGYAEGSTFINVRSNQAPGVVDPSLDTITDQNKMYAGCRVRASLTAFAYDTAGNVGVSFALNNVQRIKDGPRLDSRKAAAEEFDKVDVEPADLKGLL